ncbi:MAG: hypothetical protein R3E66_03800 [bacterium]
MQSGRNPWFFGAVMALVWAFGSMATAAVPKPTPTIEEPGTVAVPPELRPWVDWVLYDVPDVRCPSLDGVRHCIWPGELAVNVKSKGASFSYRVYVDREVTVTLPGNKDFWPQRVDVDGASGLVLKRGDQPVVNLKPGAHTISGGFDWASTPEVLAVPEDVARVSLSIASEDVDFPRVEQGKLWLGKSGVGEEDSQETIRATVFRRFEDGVPLSISTRIQLNVSGRAREISLGKILLPGSVPTQIESALPVRLPPEGDVSVFVRPGSHEIIIRAVIPKLVPSVTAPSPSPNFYDPQEVWVWVPAEQIRSVRIDGVSAVDPERTSLPADWHGHATYLVAPATKMTIAQTRRGMAEPSPNLINLDRQLWLDLDGEGYTVRDTLTGEMNQGWRLNYGKGGTLGRVYDNNEATDLFITSEPGTALSGVEIRKPSLNLTSEQRIEKNLSSLQIVGWSHDVQRLSATLSLPPGWTLLGGQGVDRMPGTWLESWTLFDFFFVLMVALTLGKLFGWRWTGLSLLALCLAHGHRDAPEWIWIGLLVTLALLRVLPQGWIRKSIVVVRACMLIGLLVILAPYARDQIRHALHPQVGSPDSFSSVIDMSSNFDAIQEQAQFEAKPMAPAPEEPMAGAAAADYDDEWDARGEVEAKSVSLSRMSKKDFGNKSGYQKLQQIDPNAVVQTGPGLPTWTWSTWSLQWTGPVRHDHTIELWLISPTVNRILALIRVILLILLALLMLAPRDTYWNEPLGIRPTFITRFLGMAPAMLALLLLPAVSRAQEFQEPNVQALVQNQNLNALPIGVSTPRSLLDELRERLIDESLCQGPCAVASRARIDVDGDILTMSAEVHAEKTTAWHLPGPADPLRIDEVKVDGVVTQDLRRDVNGLAMVRLGPGRHSVEVKGHLVNRNVVTLQFRSETRPQYVEFKSNDWTVDGIGPDGVPDNSLQLTKRVDAGDQDAALSTDLPPWFEVERRLELGSPWRIRTIVSRVDSSRPQLVKVPLTGGEKVISEDVRMENGRALVDFGRGVNVAEFLSEIPIAVKIDLTAATNEPFTETWYVQCSRTWRCQFGELPRIADVTDGVQQPMWKPWPGEKLSIVIDRPQGAPGQALTVDSVTYDVTPGKRLLQAKLKLSVRASQGGVEEITIPTGAEVQQVTVDGNVRTIRPRENVLSLPVRPGAQTFEITWQQPWERGVQETAPAVKLSTSAVNATTTIYLGEDRWLLWTYGPQWGPAILFWSHLAILLVMALLLGRIKSIPVKTWEWLLLVIGLSQLPVIAGLPVLAWFLLLAWRGKNPNEEWWKIDLAQLTTLFLTLMSLGVLYAAIHFNLLVDIDMQVRGANSTDSALRWYVDQTGPSLATPGIISLPILAFRVAMLLWAFWLVSRLIKWAKWGWGEFSEGGLWRAYPAPAPKKKGPTAPAAAAKPGEAPKETTKVGVGPESPQAEEDAVPPLDVAQAPRRKEATTVPGAPISTEPVTMDNVPEAPPEDSEE